MSSPPLGALISEVDVSSDNTSSKVTCAINKNLKKMKKIQ
jgi:hypothetical protein